jgi:hypothetical protein
MVPQRVRYAHIINIYKYPHDYVCREKQYKEKITSNKAILRGVTLVIFQITKGGIIMNHCTTNKQDVFTIQTKNLSTNRLHDIKNI